MTSAKLSAWRLRFAAALAIAASVVPAAPNAGNEASTRVNLGEQLFFDKRLSADGSISCASCHQPERAFTDALAVSVGTRGQKGTRNAPTLVNTALQASFFWDGRREKLEDQVLDPFVNAREHGLRDARQLVALVDADASYRSQFAAIFPGSEVNPANIASAIAAYVRSLSAGSSRFDRFWTGGDHAALSESERRGFEVFRGPGQCASCHAIEKPHASFTDNKFHSVGIGMAKLGGQIGAAAERSMRAAGAERDALIGTDAAVAALGRFNVTGNPADIGKYRTPGLRNVALTAPYMHDGSVPTLDEAVELELYYRSAQQGRPMVLTAREKADLVAFLRALTSESSESKQALR